MEYETGLLVFGEGEVVKSARNSMSTRQSSNSSASGRCVCSSESATPGVDVGRSDSWLSNNTSLGSRLPFWARFPAEDCQKNDSCHCSRDSTSYRYGRILVSTRMQFRAWLSGARSDGKDGWFRSDNSLDVTDDNNVSKFLNAVSRVRRISAGAMREKTSSALSGSSQN